MSTVSIPLTRGKVAVIDAADAERVLALRWYAVRARHVWYAAAKTPATGDQTILMHRFILDAPAGSMVDHKDGDGLNNTRANIRIATNAQNQRNRHRRQSNNTSGVTGVSFDKRRGRFYAYIAVDNRMINLGCYDTLDEAAAVRRRAEKELHGEFAA